MSAHQSSTAIVAAHPDDEALWLSSALASADRTVLCFGAIFERPRESHAREQAVAQLPLTGLIHLDIPESGAGYRLEPPVPELTSAGIRIEKPDARARYESNYERLIDALRSTLVAMRDIYTHNPWGEYGHPEHIQVHRAVAALQLELGYTIWFSNYMSPASWQFATHLAGAVHYAERRLVAPDGATARKLMRIYQREGAWTWNRAHCWPVEETLFSQPPPADPAPRRALCGEWLLDVTRLRWSSLPWRPLRRRLPLLGQIPGREGDVHPPPLAG